jgi:hypothetical protein
MALDVHTLMLLGVLLLVIIVCALAT